MSMKFTVERKKWIRGRPHGSCLLKSNGHMCCLGFLAKELGIQDKKLFYVQLPDMLAEDGLTVEQSEFSDIDWRDIVSTNDSYQVESNREEVLKELFLEAGYQVEFVD